MKIQLDIALQPREGYPSQMKYRSLSRSMRGEKVGAIDEWKVEKKILNFGFASIRSNSVL